MSVLKAVGAALDHLKDQPLDLDVLGALGDMRVLYTNRIGQTCWLILRPRGEPSETERQSPMQRLATALRADKAFTGAAEKVRVELMKPIDGAKDHEKRIRVLFDMPSAPTVPTESPPATVDGMRIIEQMKNAGKLSGYVERETRTERDAEERHRTEIHTALVMCEGRDPWHLWSFLADIEAKERVTVIEVRYSRDGYHMARPATAEDHGGAWVKFAVRHPWIPSDGLRGDMNRIIATRGAKGAPTQRLHLESPRERVESLVRLLSAQGVSLRQGDRLLSPTSPRVVSLAPSAAALFGAFSEALAKEGVELQRADGWASQLTITLRHDLPLAGVDAKDEKAVKAAAEKRLKHSWGAVAEHPFLKHRVGGAQIQSIDTTREEDADTARVVAAIDVDLVEDEETARSGPAAPPLAGEPLADVRAVVEAEGGALRGSPLLRRRDDRFREGLVVLRGSVWVEREALDRSAVHRILTALEGLQALSIDNFDWDGRSSLHVTMTRQHRIWNVSR